MTDDVLLEKKGRVGYIVLNRPEKHNSMNQEVIEGVKEAIKKHNEDDSVKVIVLRGNGKSFGAGYDLSPGVWPFTTIEGWRKSGENANAMGVGIWESRKIVIASVHGYCLAGAFDLTLCCDITIAADNAVFQQPDLEFGSHPAFLIMPYIVPIKDAKYMFFTGEKIDAVEAKRMHIINKIVPADKLEEETYKLANRISRIASPSMEMMKMSINKSVELAGFRNLLYISSNSFASGKMQLTEQSKHFFEISEKEGMRAAIKWREKMFVDEEEKF